MPTEILLFAAGILLCCVAEGAVLFFTSGARLEKVSADHVLASVLIVGFVAPLVVFLWTRRLALAAIVALSVAAIYLIVRRGLVRTKR